MRGREAAKRRGRKENEWVNEWEGKPANKLWKMNSNANAFSLSLPWKVVSS